MSKFMKIAAILAVAALAIAAKQFSSPATNGAGTFAATATSSISPVELMRGVGPLPHTQVDSLF